MKKRQETDTQLGWVKLHRELLDTPIMKNSKLFHIYGWCLLRANHKANWVSILTSNGNKEIKVEEGQFIMGRKKAADFLGIPESTFYANIRRLQDYGMLTIESNNQYSIVTLINTIKPDSRKQADKQPASKKKIPRRTTSKQPADTNNNKKNNKNKNKVNNDGNSMAVSPTKKKTSKRINDFVKAKYDHLLDIVSKQFPYIESLEKQISLDELKILLQTYDWKDIIRKMDDLESWDKIDKQKSFYHILRKFLTNDEEVRKINGIKQNSAYKSYKKYLADLRAKRKEEAEKLVRDDFFNQIKNDALWNEDYADYDDNERREIVDHYFQFKATYEKETTLPLFIGPFNLSFAQYLDFRILDFHPTGILRNLKSYGYWNGLDQSVSFHENFGEYLMFLAEKLHS